MKFFNFLARIIQSNSKESSKRVGFIYTLFVLVTFVVIVFTKQDNAISVLEILLWFCGALVGLSVTQFAVDRLGKKSITPPGGDPPKEEDDPDK